MIASGINLVMTVIGFSVSTTFIVFICTRLFCARMQLNASRRSIPIAMVPGFELSMLERGMHGLEASVLANLPMKKFGDVCAKDETESQCTICLAEYHDDDSLRFIPYCGHSFHQNCIDIWLRQHATCPICRTSTREISEKKHLMEPMFSPPSRPRYVQGSHQIPIPSYHCVLNSHGYNPSRTRADFQMEPIQEDHSRYPSNDPEAGDSEFSSSSVQHVDKDARRQQMGSPSIPE